MTNLTFIEEFTVYSDSEIHHETELGFMIGKQVDRFYVNNGDWKDYIGGYFLCLDLTDRSLQASFKKKGQPWSLSKCQDNFMPMSNFIPVSDIDDPHNLDLGLKINGKTVQSGNTKDMIFDIPFLLEFLSQYVTLNEGDMIITGTPEGVGPVNDKDVLEGYISENGKTVQTFDFLMHKEPIPESKFKGKI